VWCEISPTDRGGPPAHALGARAGRPRRARRFRRTAWIVWRTTARAHRNRGRWLEWAARRRLEWAARLCQVAGPALSAIAHVGVARRVGRHPALSSTVEAQPRGWRAGGLTACDPSPGTSQRLHRGAHSRHYVAPSWLPTRDPAGQVQSAGLRAGAGRRRSPLGMRSRRGAGASLRTSQAREGSRSRARRSSFRRRQP
jgi:hypothetical protein